MSGRRALISVMLHVVDHDLSQGPSPASVWVMFNGSGVLDGGSYPDESDNAISLSIELPLDKAELIQANLAMILQKLGVETECELILDD